MNTLYSSRIQHIPTSYIREILNYANKPGVISFAGGIPEESLFPLEEIQLSMNNVMLRSPIRALQYSNTEGNGDLRQLIAEDYKQKGIDITEENIIITNGSQQGLDLVAKLFLEKKKKVLVEGPSYLGAIQCFSQYECEFEEIPLEEDGPNAELLLDSLWEHHPHIPFMYMIPDFQNPTGIQYSLEKRIEIGKILQQHSIWMLEDSPYRELQYYGESIPSLLELYPTNTIQLGSFSKILTPGLRLGWIVAPKILIASLKKLKQASDLHSSGLVQELILDLKLRGVIRKHLPTILNAYKQRRDTMMEGLNPLSNYMKIFNPNGGMFCWAELFNTNAEELNRECIKQNLVFVPGHHFYSNTKNDKTLRLNFSKNNPQEISNGLKILESALQFVSI